MIAGQRQGSFAIAYCQKQSKDYVIPHPSIRLRRADTRTSKSKPFDVAYVTIADLFEMPLAFFPSPPK